MGEGKARRKRHMATPDKREGKEPAMGLVGDG
jgi:hypothetical protein